MDVFDKLLEEDEFVQRQRELGFQEGFLEGKIEGYQMILVDMVKDKFPSLEDLARQKAAQTRQVDVLHELILLAVASKDENITRFILDPFGRSSQ